MCFLIVRKFLTRKLKMKKIWNILQNFRFQKKEPQIVLLTATLSVALTDCWQNPLCFKNTGDFLFQICFLIVFLLISSQNKKIQGSYPSIGFSISPSSSDYGTQKSTKHFVGSSLVLLILYIAIRCFPCSPQILARSSLFVLDRFPSTPACAGSLPPAPCMLPTNGIDAKDDIDDQHFKKNHRIYARSSVKTVKVIDFRINKTKVKRALQLTDQVILWYKFIQSKHDDAIEFCVVSVCHCHNVTLRKPSIIITFQAIKKAEKATNLGLRSTFLP